MKTSTSCIFLIAAGLSACTFSPVKSPDEPVIAQPAVLGTQWTAFAIDGVPEVSPPKPYLKWLSTNQVAGSGGCNGFSGAVVAQLANLRFGPLAATRKMCLTLPGGQEDKFFKALEQTRKARLENGQLVLLDEAGATMARLLPSN